MGIGDASGIIPHRSSFGVDCYDMTMSMVPLKSYLRTYRKRAGLTNDEMAFLAGSMSGTSVTRHENARRLPLLRTALIYELILRVPVRSLYEGLLFETMTMVRTRAL